MGPALASLPDGCQVLVVDAESTDATAVVARAAGARVIVRPWEGFVATRRFALAQVATQWTLMLDADETLDPDLRRALEELAAPADVEGYRVRRVTFLCGRPVLAGAWGFERLLRVFRTSAARLEAVPAAGGSASIHERWQVGGAVRDLPGVVLHDSYPTLRSYREKFARYTSLEAQGTTFSIPRLAAALARGGARVPWALLVRGGWRDGWRGALVAVASAAYPVVVLVKAARR